MTAAKALCAILLSALLSMMQCDIGVAFAPSLATNGPLSVVKSPTWCLFANMDDDDDDGDANAEPRIPQLPAAKSSKTSPLMSTQNEQFFASPQSVGELTQPTNAKRPDTPELPKQTKTPIANVGSPTLQLQYTCKVCDTRNCHQISRVAYREGLVIATCKGCNSKHLIADHLGSSQNSLEGTIEDYMAAKGGQDLVQRVSREVFDLEKVLSIDSSGGALVGDDGKPVME